MTLRQLLACITLLTISASASAAKLIPNLQQLDAVPIHSLSAPAMQKAVAAALSKSKPLQFAVTASLPLSLDDGAWQKLDDGTWSWRTRIYSAGAQTLNLHFAKFHLPAGAALWLYDPSGTVIAGPYTSANELGDDQLWTAVINSETVIAEVRVSAASKDQVRLQLAEVNHGYRNFSKATRTGFGAAGLCETDVVCPANASYLTEARSLARITINGNTLCSGQLVNNVRQDNTPLFLTANHCGITAKNAGSVVFYWNYQNSVCGGNGTEPVFQTQSGSKWIAGDVTSDFTLIKAAQTPNASFNLYLAGWNAGSTPPQSGSIVHHPLGDVTKISTYSTAATSVDNVGLCDGDIDASTGKCDGTTRKINVWQVTYSQGVTEGGSSGSALYDQNHQLVGQLSGGKSACVAAVSNGQPDIYGRTNAAWTASSSPCGQLKASLDADGTGTLTLAGKDLGTVASGGTTTGELGCSSSSSGGGAFPPLTLAGLATLLALRRRRTSRHALSI